ncbi:MAG: hypothetical protein ACYTG0_09405 [Planctomycetota bacterium]|jgi:hypothetical protein
MSALALSLVSLLASGAAPQSGKYFEITVVDGQTGRGVPLVELRTVHNVRYYTDSNGLVALYEPGLTNHRVFFHVASHGYEFPEDGFGYRGKALQVTEGGSATLAVKRINVAERLYRVTGAGIYRDSLLVGRPVPTERPVLNGLVFGSDSVVNTVYGGKIHWFWGDTNRPAYPLGNFHVPGATSLLPADGGLDPEVGVDLEYFVGDKGFAKETARMPGDGPTWINGLVTVGDAAGRQRLFAAYVKVRKFLEVYQRGLVEFNPEKHAFEKVVEFDMDAPVHPGGHPVKHTVDGVEHVYFANPFPLIRVPADPERITDLSSYEAFTCLKEGSRLDQPQPDRAANGRLRYGWKRDAPPITPGAQQKLVQAGHLTPQEARPRLRDAASGKPVRAHGGSVYWNEFRNRWVMIVLEVGGTSMLGEIWYAEADTLEGPWAYARKVVTHEKYSFYNPKQHPMLDKQGGRVILFEGTYTALFSGNPEHTPWYNYNQIMYKLDLAEPRLALPVAVYRLTEGDAAGRFVTASQLDPIARRHPVAFFAPDLEGEATIPVYQWLDDGGQRLGLDPPPESSLKEKPQPLFYGLPPDAEDPPAAAVPLYEYLRRDGTGRSYRLDESWSAAGYQRGKRPICLVWPDPGGN